MSFRFFFFCDLGLLLGLTFDLLSPVFPDFTLDLEELNSLFLKFFNDEGIFIILIIIAVNESYYGSFTKTLFDVLVLHKVGMLERKLAKSSAHLLVIAGYVMSELTTSFKSAVVFH